MRKMSEHAQELDWAANWFRRSSRGVSGLTALVVVIQVVLLSKPPIQNAAFNTPTSSFLNGFIVTLSAIAGLTISFALQAGSIICSFLADFARGLLAQQVRLDRQDKS